MQDGRTAGQLQWEPRTQFPSSVTHSETWSALPSITDGAEAFLTYGPRLNHLAIIVLLAARQHETGLWKSKRGGQPSLKTVLCLMGKCVPSLPGKLSKFRKECVRSLPKSGEGKCSAVFVFFGGPQRCFQSFPGANYSAWSSFPPPQSLFERIAQQ